MKKDIFLEKANNIHNNQYTYQVDDIVNNYSYIEVNCVTHGIFKIKVHNHIHHKNGCPFCEIDANTNRPFKTNDQFIYKAKLVHGDKYTYDNTDISLDKGYASVTCLKHGDFKISTNNFLHKKRGCPHCSKDLNLTTTGNVCVEKYRTAYTKWNNMVVRCYNDSYQKKQPSYADCKLCEEWHSFEKFLTWFNDPINGYKEGYQIDKDLLSDVSSKIYSPETCCFVPQEINCLLTRSERGRGKIKSIGVTYKNNRYVARCNFGYKQLHSLGTYDTEQEAFDVYKKAKTNFIKETAEKYFSSGDITERVYKALLNYKVRQYDE